ncbi:hypothetical protein L248_0645 [Schleiferilactobacillus shenzhenensis LY-73]|uniref:Uncharacterized protein n=1 Tax=Schleiferilactobacillus shenzhenensis LY-73 TaxID=1231336 RepID=U4TIT1_9LACO|nr:hypothetical protein L248_0645 [Schleiferilactobacillus shenzhenensis LY-73]
MTGTTMTEDTEVQSKAEEKAVVDSAMKVKNRSLVFDFHCK